MLEIKKQHPDYIWIAQYKDGNKFCEYKDDEQNKFDDIDLDRLSKLIIVGKNGECSINLQTGEFDIFGIKIKSNTLPQGKYRPIWFKRHRHDFTPEGEKHSCQYVFGVQTTILEGQVETNYQQLFWIQEDGSVLINGQK